jgi:hypothetical protein
MTTINDLTNELYALLTTYFDNNGCPLVRAVYPDGRLHIEIADCPQHDEILEKVRTYARHEMEWHQCLLNS